MSRVIAAAVAVVVLMAGSLYMQVAAPCSWFEYGSVKDMPARCLLHR